MGGVSQGCEGCGGDGSLRRVGPYLSPAQLSPSQTLLLVPLSPPLGKHPSRTKPSLHSAFISPPFLPQAFLASWPLALCSSLSAVTSTTSSTRPSGSAVSGTMCCEWGLLTGGTIVRRARDQTRFSLKQSDSLWSPEMESLWDLQTELPVSASSCPPSVPLGNLAEVGWMDSERLGAQCFAGRKPGFHLWHCQE